MSKRASVWLAPQDQQAIAAIARHLAGLDEHADAPTDSEAIRWALRFVAAALLRGEEKVREGGER